MRLGGWPDSGVTTNEDTLVSLNLKMPAITDAVDQTGRALPATIRNALDSSR